MKKIKSIAAKLSFVIASLVLVSLSMPSIALADSGWGTFNETVPTGYPEWSGLSSSYTGQYQVGVDDYQDPVNISSNYGQTFTSISISGSPTFSSIGVSGTGQYMVAGDEAGGVYISNDYGQTWTPRSVSGVSQSVFVSSSNSGQDMAAAVYGDGIYTSSNYGQTWTAVGTTGIGSNNNFYSIAESSNGQYITAGTYHEGFFVSNDYGQSWTSASGPFSSDTIFSISMSYSGQYQYATIEGGDLYESTNYGQSWTDVSSSLANVSEMYFVSSSASGQYVTFSSYAGDDYVSSDYGQSWTDLTTGSSAPIWSYPLAISGNGEYITINSYDNGIFVASNPSLASVTNVDFSSTSGSAINLSTPDGTNITCDSPTTENSLSSQDSGYTYPLGLVNFCYYTSNSSDQVSVTFATKLTPSQVVPRDYNPITKQWTTIPSAQVTETTLNGESALKLTYTIADNGSLDSSSTVGYVADPVGLAVVDTAPNTGYGTPSKDGFIEPGIVVSGVLILLGYAIRQKKIT